MNGVLGKGPAQRRKGGGREGPPPQASQDSGWDHSGSVRWKTTLLTSAHTLPLCLWSQEHLTSNPTTCQLWASYLTSLDPSFHVW